MFTIRLQRYRGWNVFQPLCLCFPIPISLFSNPYISVCFRWTLQDFYSNKIYNNAKTKPKRKKVFLTFKINNFDLFEIVKIFIFWWVKLKPSKKLLLLIWNVWNCKLQTILYIIRLRTTALESKPLKKMAEKSLKLKSISNQVYIFQYGSTIWTRYRGGSYSFIISTLVKPLKSKVYKRRTVKFARNMWF